MAEERKRSDQRRAFSRMVEIERSFDEAVRKELPSSTRYPESLYLFGRKERPEPPNPRWVARTLPDEEMITISSHWFPIEVILDLTCLSLVHRSRSKVWCLGRNSNGENVLGWTAHPEGTIMHVFFWKTDKHESSYAC